MKASSRDLRYHLKSIMEAVDRGESVLITHRGKPRAKIVPVAADEENSETENPFVGMWKDREEMKNVRTYVRTLRRGRLS